MKAEIMKIVALLSVIGATSFAVLPSVIGLDGGLIVASTQVQGICDLVVTPLSIDFGLLQAGHTSGIESVNMKDNAVESNLPSQVQLDGSVWSDGTNSFAVGNTQYGFGVAPGTALTGTTTSIGTVSQDSVGTTVNFQVSVPANTAAGSYSQTITVTFSCS